MAASLYVAKSWSDRSPANPVERSVWLDSDGYYWHLYRYFETAKSELWQTVEKNRLIEIINRILWLIRFARDEHLKLIVSGD